MYRLYIDLGTCWYIRTNVPRSITPMQPDFWVKSHPPTPNSFSDIVRISAQSNQDLPGLPREVTIPSGNLT